MFEESVTLNNCEENAMYQKQNSFYVYPYTSFKTLTLTSTCQQKHQNCQATVGEHGEITAKLSCYRGVTNVSDTYMLYVLPSL